MSLGDLFEDAQDLFPRVCEMYGKTESEVNRDTESVKEWMKAQPHLPEIMPESHIRNFLVINKLSIEKTKQNIDNYYTVRSSIFFENSNPKSPQMTRSTEVVYVCVHPKLVDGLHRVCIAKLKRFEPEEFVVSDIVSRIANESEVRFYEDYIVNDIILCDASGATYKHIMQFTPSVLLKLISLYQKVLSFRFKACYVIHAPSYMSKLLTILKPLVKSKIFDKIHVSENDDILKELFTIDSLPKDFGGNGPSLEELTNVMKMKFDQYQNRFDQLDKMRVDESLRPKELVNDEMLGFYGNFKMLNID